VGVRPAERELPPVERCLLLVERCLLLVERCLLPVERCLLPVEYNLQSMECNLRAVVHSQRRHLPIYPEMVPQAPCLDIFRRDCQVDPMCINR
jgi:hypothetical protein